MPVVLSLALGTLISEDLTCISAGVLIQRGTVDPVSAIVACATGILAGDIALWAIGRLFGEVALTWTWVGRHLEKRGIEPLRRWLQDHAASAILWSRFLPGTRLPLYVTAGVFRMPCALFACWAAVGALLWTPTLVLATAKLGDAAVLRLPGSLFAAWAPALVIVVTARTAGKLARSIRRRNGLTPP
jgi:membrane protein DedA with SNARE-associated domain